MKLVYDIHEKPKFGANLVFAIQQLLAIIAATLLVPALVNGGQTTIVMDQAAALLGAGLGTIVYLLCTNGKSPVFLGSSFAFISPLIGAAACGFLGLIIGAVVAGAVYLVIALVIHFVGTKWVDKLMPPVIIGPTVALIGLSLCGSAVTNLTSTATSGYNLIAIICGIFAFLVTVFASVKGSKSMKLFPFIIGILGGYILASIFTLIGSLTGNEYLKIIDYTPLTTMDSIIHIPEFTIVQAIKNGEFSKITGTDIANIAVLFAPVAFVVFAEHIADHKNLSSIIGRDLIKEPGLSKTLTGDGLGSIVGTIFGGCPNTTYGECVGCVAITGNASVYTIATTSILCIVIAFCNPIIQFVNTIPSCVMGGICIALYGFIAVSGLRMIQKGVDLDKNRNLFVVAAVLVTGIGNLTLNFGAITITGIATALIVGIITNLIVKGKNDAEESAE